MNISENEQRHVNSRISMRIQDKSNLLSGFAGAFAQTSEFKEIVRAIVPEIISTWAGKSIIKRIILKPFAKNISKSFLPSDSDSDNNPVLEFFKNPETINEISEQMPLLINGFIEAVTVVSENMTKLSSEEKLKFLDEIINNINAGNIGTIITNFTVFINNIHESNPMYLTEKLRPIIQNLIINTDFGEIKEALDKSSDDLVGLIGMINEEMWQYPAKIVSLFSLMPALINIVIKSLVKTVEPINQMSPDMLADVLISLIREVEGKNIGSLINEFNEVLRKIHTGSVLLGDQGKPLLPLEISKFLKDTISTLDINLMLKAENSIRDIKETTLISFIDLLKMNPALAKEFFQRYFRSIVASVRSWSYKVNAFEAIFTEEEISEEFERGIGEIDAQEVADTINRICTLLNQARKLSPGVIRNTLSQLISSIEEHEVSETVKWLTEDIVKSLKPLAPEIMPPIIRGIADLITLDNDDSSGELQSAISYFKNAINGTEAV